MLCAKLCYMNHINYKTSAAAASAPAPPRQGLRGVTGRARLHKKLRGVERTSSDRLRTSSVMRGGIARRGGI